MTHSAVRKMPYTPRRHQAEIHAALKRFNVLVCHRRFGKTVLAVNQLISSALRCPHRAPQMAYIAPYAKQAKAVAWDALRQYAAPFIRRTTVTELRVDLFNGAQISLHSGDNPDALRGLYLDGVVLDEYADMPSRTWGEVVRPALADRLGWAIFIGTPKGQNAFYDLYQRAQSAADWYAAMFKASDTGVITDGELRSLQAAMTPEEYAQEFECAFQVPSRGAFYAKDLGQAERDNRIGRVPWDPTVPVVTAWDLGMDDATVIWFCQQVGKEVRLIDYYENAGEPLTHYAGVVRAKPYTYDIHLLPHDVKTREYSDGRSRLETLEGLGLNCEVVPLRGIADGINAVRLLLPRCWFDGEKCAQGLKALRSYQREWDPSGATWRQRPLHDWTSHAADAFRYLALGLRPLDQAPALRYDSRGIY
jgi:hypothetical protein